MRAPSKIVRMLMPLTVRRLSMKQLSKPSPLVQGMISCGILFPTGCFLQQVMAGRGVKDINYAQCARFCVFGSLYVAPTLYAWIRLTSAMWPQTNWRTGLTKALIEQFSYGPFGNVSFFMGTSLLELKTLREAIQEVEYKFMPTYKVGLLFWPFVQTINYSLVPEKYRIFYVGMCSLIWTVFLEYMKEQKMDKATIEFFPAPKNILK